jgi:membrane-associated phospholipid phosphatase
MTRQRSYESAILEKVDVKGARDPMNRPERIVAAGLAILAGLSVGLAPANGTLSAPPVLLIVALAVGFPVLRIRLRRAGVAPRAALVALFIGLVFFTMGPLVERVASWDAAAWFRRVDRSIGADWVPLAGVLNAPGLLAALAICYLWFLLYLSYTVLQLVFVRRDLAASFLSGWALIYMIGFVFYLLVPGLGPKYQHPEAYVHLARGGALLRFSDWLAVGASATRGIFPSLHAAGALYVWSFDAWARPRRARLCAVPVLGVMPSTVLLGYHYTIDVLAGILLAAVGWIAARAAARDSLATPAAA